MTEPPLMLARRFDPMAKRGTLRSFQFSHLASDDDVALPGPSGREYLKNKSSLPGVAELICTKSTLRLTREVRSTENFKACYSISNLPLSRTL